MNEKLYLKILFWSIDFDLQNSSEEDAHYHGELLTLCRSKQSKLKLRKSLESLQEGNYSFFSIPVLLYYVNELYEIFQNDVMKRNLGTASKFTASIENEALLQE